MVTQNKRTEKVFGFPLCEFDGLSSDSKPTDCYNGSLFFEMDTKKVFKYDAENETWLEL